MFMGLGMPIPDLSNKPGPGRPGWGPTGSYDFQFEVTGAVTIKAQPAATGTFTIKWPNGTEQTTAGSNSITAPDATAGIISINNEELDTTWCDDFSVASGKQFVTKVISWGQNPWNRLQDAFKDCTNLTEISTTSLITDTTGNLTSLFSGCTGLTEAIIKNWDLSQGARLSNLFNNCTNLEKTDWTGLNIKLTAESPRILYAAGSTTTNGCEFLMSNINLSTSTTARLGNAGQGLWQNSKIKANSNFSGWTFPSGIVYAQLSSVFQNASVPASNATINISNWSFAGNTYTQNNLQNAFNSFNSAAGNASTGLKLNMSNWNFGDARWTMESMFNSFKGDQIIGLSTWTVGSGAIYNMKSWAQSTFNLKILSNDNISNSFASSININTGTQYAFQNMSSNYTLESDWGVFPNLSGADFSSNPVLTAMFMNTRFTTPPNLDNVTFHPGGASNNYESFMSGMKLSGSQGVDFTNVTMKPSRFNSAFQQADIAFLKFGSGVDFSEVGRIESFAYLATMPDNTLEFATNLSFGSLTNSSNFPGHKMSVCQTDNFIRRLYATQPTDAGVTSGSIYFDNSAVTESPSVVRNTANLLVSPGGWSLNGLNSTDATMPFVYTGSFLTGTDITPTINTSGGTFSSSDVTVNSATGTFNTSTAGNVTIRYTITATGCYNEQVLSVVPRFSPFKFRVTGPISIKAQPAVAGQNFTIDWGDGSTPVSTPGGTSIASPSYPAGTYDVQINAQSDATYCDEFAIVSGQTNVTQVLDWGENPWNKLASAFADCVNLTDISTTSLITDGVGNCDAIFLRCTSLLEIDAKNWQVSSGWKAAFLIKDCTNLTKVDMTGLSMKLGRSENWMENVGTNVADGCEFLMSGISFLSGSGSSTYQPYWFKNSKIKPTSTFASWSWGNGFTDWNGTGMFQNTDVTGVNSTLDASGWTTFPGSTLRQYIQSINYTDGVTNNNLTVDFTGLNVSNVNNMLEFAYYADVYKIKGISTWGATAGNINMQRAFGYAKFLKTPTSDNFSNAFIQSLTPTNLYETFASMGMNLPESDLEASVNLNGLDVSNSTSFTNTWYQYHSNNSLDFSNVTFGSTLLPSFGSTWARAYAHESNSTLNFPNQIVASSFSSSFDSTKYDNITFGNNVDFSQVTTVSNMLAYQKTGVNITFPTVASGLSFASLTSAGNWFAGTTGPTTGPLTTCQVDNLIRAFYNTALNNGLSVNFGTSHITESPSVVSTMVDELENTGGWNITPNTLDATIPFEYTGTLAPNTPITPTNNTGSPFTGTKFSSSNSNIAVNATTGVINSPNGGNTTIRYTLDDGCYTEQAISLVSAEFSYSASAYCQDAATDPIPTVTGTSGGTFTAALKVIPFQMQFDTSGGKTITIPGTVGSSFTVDWGDTTVTTETGGTISHTYDSGIPTSTVSIGATGDSGPFTSLAFNNSGSKSDLIDIPQWGNIEFSSFSTMFHSCNNLDISATDTPDLSNCTNYYRAFYNCSSLTGTLSGVNWNWTFNGGSLSFRETFMRCELFNGDVSNWNISGAISLRAMFSCYSRPRGVFNRNLNSWDTSSVTDMSGVFYNQSFNGDIYNWDTSSANTMSGMFYDCIYFNQDINTKDTGTRLAWDVSSCSNFSNMFYNTSSFVTSINKWKIKTTGSTFSMSDMFRNANYNQTLNTSEVTVGQGGYQQTYLAWDVQKVNNFYRMFSGSSFNQSLSNWDTSSATNMNSMFSSSSFNQPITSQSVTVGSGSNQRTYNAWDVSLVSDTFRMFRSNTNFNQDLSSWDVSNLSNIGQMFSYSSVFNQNISDWNIINLSNGSLCFVSNNVLTTENYTDSIVGWAVTVYNNSGSPSTVNFSGNGKTFDGTRTSDNASGQTYVAKYGANWPSVWTNNNAQDAFDYLTTTLSWTIN